MSPEMVPLLSTQIEIFSSILTYFKPISHQYPLISRQKPSGFLTFSWGIEMEHWREMS